jgi:hypothetical protein
MRAYLTSAHNSAEHTRPNDRAKDGLMSLSHAYRMVMPDLYDIMMTLIFRARYEINYTPGVTMLLAQYLRMCGSSSK